MVPTGVAIALPAGYAAFVHPRSGLAPGSASASSTRPAPSTPATAARSRCCSSTTTARDTVRLRRGDRIAQLVVQRVERARFHEVELLPGSARGEGGHGSTGGFAEPDPETAQPDQTDQTTKTEV